MFTGIIQTVGSIQSLVRSHLIVISDIPQKKLGLGDSISVNGACLTIVSISKKGFAVDLSSETLKKTNLSNLAPGHLVNLELPMTLNDSLGGHIVQGHIDDKGKISSIIDSDGSMLFKVKSPRKLMPYIVDKGYIAIDGISLTVVNTFVSSFTVSVIPYTLNNSNLKNRCVNDEVNLEVDIIAKYVERNLKLRSSDPLKSNKG